MIDFHSHILPGIDDGAKDVQTSLDILAESYSQGIRTIVATPHCRIANENDIAFFLENREKSFNALKKAMANDNRDFPDIVLGAEVQVTKGVTDFETLKPLCIGNTDYILIEMPYTAWNEDCYDYLYMLILHKMKPIMAHIERYLNRKKEFINLYSLDLCYQVNADSFLSPFIRHNIPDLFSNGTVHIFGSDVHNTNRRATHMKQASVRIAKSYGAQRLNYLMSNSEKILNNEPVVTKKYEKLSFFKKYKV